jgi:hypothetical protein
METGVAKLMAVLGCGPDLELIELLYPPRPERRRRMSTDEQITAIGRLVMEARASNERVVLLKAELDRMSKALRTASETINGLTQGIDYPDLPATMAKIPPDQAVIDACAEYRTELARSKELKVQVAALGL